MMLDNPQFKYFAHVGIRPAGSLEATAKVIGDILGLHFVEDVDNRYDEYPAFVSEMGPVRYALLGVPSPEDDLRDEPTNDFELMVEPIVLLPQATKKDVSELLVEIISKDGRIICWDLR